MLTASGKKLRHCATVFSFIATCERQAFPNLTSPLAVMALFFASFENGLKAYQTENGAVVSSFDELEVATPSTDVLMKMTRAEIAVLELPPDEGHLNLICIQQRLYVGINNW